MLANNTYAMPQKCKIAYWLVHYSDFVASDQRELEFEMNNGCCCDDKLLSADVLANAGVLKGHAMHCVHESMPNDVCRCKHRWLHGALFYRPTCLAWHAVLCTFVSHVGGQLTVVTHATGAHAMHVFSFYTLLLWTDLAYTCNLLYSTKYVWLYSWTWNRVETRT